MDIQISNSLPIVLSPVKMGAMPRQNKTDQILLRVYPEFKQEAKEIADLMGKNLTEVFEAALEVYKRSPEVRKKQKEARDALANATKQAEGS